jgi:hypothetical protein
MQLATLPWLAAPADLAIPVDLAPPQEGSRSLYFSMLDERGGMAGQSDELARARSRSFLLQQLGVAAAIQTDFPADMRSLPGVMRKSHDQAAKAYRRYLAERRAGSPRRYFSCRSHALYFLRAVAPTKLVDGAWLYGLLQRWQDPRLAPLIRTYLEELGEGNPLQNHVLIYQRLLARYGCDKWQDGADQHFTQGAVQLALAHHAHEFLPELIGFNLGYEQLPLHLPITAYELNELDIDSYYFSLHLTIDNASTGHARKALQSVLDCTPRIGNVAEFHWRVGNGYRLNQIGMGTHQAIAAFDLERELQRVIIDKAAVGAQLHSNYCLIAGRPVSEWLSSPSDIGNLLAALQSSGWIHRGESPEKSRFWRLLTDAQAPMFGVFDGYEQQLLRDWILADSESTPRARAINRFCRRPPPGVVEGVVEGTVALLPGEATTEQIIAQHASGAPRPGSCADVDALFQQLAGVNTKAKALAVLAGMLSPANHSNPVGLAATRLYADLFSR